MKNKFTKQNILFAIIIALLLIPQTRYPIQLLVHKGLSYINQSTIIEEGEREILSYQNWKLISDNGEVLNLKDLKGRVLFINFWATWCPPCIVEMPSLQDLYNDFNEEVVFLFVTGDELETVRKFKTKNSYSFKVYNAVNKIPQNLETKSIPRTFIIDKAGAIVVDEKGAVDWYSQKVKTQLTTLLAE
ncbi:TlpA family protein disulfide reductase [Winogradskyella alexanderae]|uniref:TlpA family protein disulfide reductase n=1 Tax=Winogradskyella alexanderae TaxID=2877123 RepID=A0ABS7XU66_9FLAO|nr:TlpA disulfide reductase family protein [Winogradskyella alexanderae]MCA0132356.1 TlpA family protein disulfide reductase [Winogradskyella alexanderae]